MIFKNENVKVLEQSTFLTKIEDKEGREFWVKTVDLKSEVKAARHAGVKAKKIHVQHKYAVYTSFLDFLHGNATIRVQLPPQSVEGFKANYQRVTGEDVEALSEHVSIIPDESKWGVAITVLFPALGKELVPAGLTAFTYGQDKNVLGICNSDFAWELFSLGFRIGTKQKDTLIMEAQQ